MLLIRCLSVLFVLSVCDVRVLWPNGWMDQDVTWHSGRCRPRSHCVRWGSSSPYKGAQPPLFGPCLLWPNGWMDQDATLYSPGRIALDGEPSTPEKGGQQPPVFGPCLLWPNGPPSKLLLNTCFIRNNERCYQNFSVRYCCK